MAEVVPQQDGSVQVTVTAADAAALKGLAATHLPFLARAQQWFSKEVAPEVHEAADFLRSLAANPPEGSTLTVSASEAQALRGLLDAHVPDFQQVLAIVESPAVRAMLGFAKALL